MLTLIVRLAQTRAMIALAIVWAIVFGAILITMGQLAEATGGSGILDFEVGYSAERVAAILGSYGAEGMALYGRIQLLDLINPALYSLLLAAITHRLYRDTGPAWIALVPLLGEHPLEMGLAGNEDAALARLSADPRYEALFAAAYGDNAITFENVVRALATFQRRLVSLNSPYDRYLAGDAAALSPSAQRGLELFFSETLKCARCHGGANFRFTPGHRRDDSDQSVAFHNTGLYNLDGSGAYPARDRGLFDLTGVDSDMGRFKAPTLRNIALTAPYMHDGSIATLDEVLAHYARGGRRIETGPDAGDGRLSPLKSELVAGFVLTEEETEHVLAFLHSLTDEEFVADGALADPF